MKKALYALCALLCLCPFPLGAVPGVKDFLPTESGQYVYYKDATFQREAYVGFLQYDEARYAIRYYAPENTKTGQKEEQIELFLTVDTEKDYILMTGERIVAKEANENTATLNYLHDLFYEFASQRKKVNGANFKGSSAVPFSVQKTENIALFGGEVSLTYDYLIPIFNLRSITNKKGEKEIITRTENGAVTYINAKGEKEEYQGAYINISNKQTGKQSLGMVDTIQIFMLLAASIMMIYSGIKAAKIAQNEIFHSGMVALVAIYGISWMADTMFHSHIEMLKGSLGEVMKAYPWMYIIVGMLISKFLNSQAAAAATFVPLAVQIGVDPGIIIAFATACYGYFILPTYPSDLAAIQFDRSGTTKIGKYVINHSFIIPGFIGVFSSCAVGWVLANIYGFIN